MESKKFEVSVNYGQSETIAAFLKKFNEWTKKVSDEPFETFYSEKTQTFSCGYEVEHIQTCGFGYRINVFLKERAIKENDCTRMGDVVSFIYIGKEDTLYLDAYAEDSKKWHLGFKEVQ